MGSFSDSDRKDLEDNPNVLKVTASNVSYTPKFKALAVKLAIKGKSPREIFMEAGINLELFGKEYAKSCIKKWRKIIETFGEVGLKEERRGSKATGRPKGQKFKSVEEELAWLRAENDFLKKLRALRIANSQKNKSSR